MGAGVDTCGSSSFSLMVREKFTVFLVRLHSKTERTEDEEEVIYLAGADECVRNEVYGKYEVAQSQHAQQEAQFTTYTALVQYLKEVLDRRQFITHATTNVAQSTRAIKHKSSNNWLYEFGVTNGECKITLAQLAR